MAAVARPHEQIEQRSRLRAEFPAPTGAVVARGGDELCGDVLSGAHGMNLQRSMTNPDRPTDRDRYRVVDVEAPRAGSRDHFAVPVEQHGPSVDPVCEFGDDTRDAAASRREGEDPHRGGDRPRLRSLVDGEKCREPRHEQLLRRPRPDDRGDPRRGEHLAERRCVCARDEHDAAHEGCAFRIVDEREDRPLVRRDQRREEPVGRDAERVDRDDRVHVSCARDLPVQELAIQVPRHGDDITNHVSIIRNVESRRRPSHLCRMP